MPPQKPAFSFQTVFLIDTHRPTRIVSNAILLRFFCYPCRISDTWRSPLFLTTDRHFCHIFDIYRHLPRLEVLTATTHFHTRGISVQAYFSPPCIPIYSGSHLGIVCSWRSLVQGSFPVFKTRINTAQLNYLQHSSIIFPLSWEKCKVWQKLCQCSLKQPREQIALRYFESKSKRGGSIFQPENTSRLSGIIFFLRFHNRVL